METNGVSLMNRLLRDALILALVPLVAAVIGFFALIQTHDAYWLGLLVWTAIAFSLFEWGGLTTAPWHTISKYAQIDHWLYWLLAALPIIVVPFLYAIHAGWLVAALFGVALGVYEVWWWHHIFHSIIPRLLRKLRSNT
jgi:hypothetical protein